MRYKLNLQAEDDMIRIYRYGLEKFGEAQATRYYYGLIAAFEKIAENPYMFPSAEHITPGYRICPYKADTIYFRIGEEVEIMTIIGRYNKEIDASIAQVKSGKTYTHQQVGERIKQWGEQ